MNSNAVRQKGQRYGFNVADVLAGAGQREATESDRLADVAVQVSANALAATMVAAAGAIIKILAKRESTPAAVSAEMRQLRTDSGLAQALEHDTRSTRATTYMLIADALWLGFQTAADGRSEGLPVAVALDESDRDALRDYPILGHTAGEVADDLMTKLRWESDAALAAPLVSGDDPQTITVALATVGQQHAGRVGFAVQQAYYAGVQAAVRAIGSALTGVEV